MPRSEHPYLVCARAHGQDYLDLFSEAPEDMPELPPLADPLLGLGLEDEDDDPATDFEIAVTYTLNVHEPEPAAPPWAGLNQLHRIMQDLRELHSPESTQNNAPESTQARHLALMAELANCASRTFLQCFRILSPAFADQWRDVQWTYDIFRDGLEMTSVGHVFMGDGLHRISFQWDTDVIYNDEDEGVISRLRVINVRYTGPFELEEREYF
jgi:hypothetical protein